MGIVYDSLLKGLVKAEMADVVIIDRSKDKVETVSLKKFKFFSNVLEVANTKLRKINKEEIKKSDKATYKERKVDAKTRLEGEKRLTQLRTFNKVYETWQKTISSNELPDTLKDLKKENKKLDKVLAKMEGLKSAIGGDKIDLAVFENISKVDQDNFIKLNQSINALKVKKEILQSHINIKEGKTLSTQQAKKIVKVQDRANSTLRNEAANTLKVNLYKNSAALKDKKKEIIDLIDNRNIKDVNQIVSLIKEYESLNAQLENDYLELKGMPGSISERASKDIADLIINKDLFSHGVLRSVRVFILTHNEEAKKLDISKRYGNDNAVFYHKAGEFFKELEGELIKVAKEKKAEALNSRYEQIEKDEPAIEMTVPNAGTLEGLDKRQQTNLIKDHRDRFERMNEIRNGIISEQREKAKTQIDEVFGDLNFAVATANLTEFPFVKALIAYREGRITDAGKHILDLWMQDKKKVPSWDQFKVDFKDITDVEPDNKIYDDLLQTFHNTQGLKIAKKTWDMFLFKEKRLPEWEEFKGQFEEKIGIEPEKESFQALVDTFSTRGKQAFANNIWNTWFDQNKKYPSWNEFKTKFKANLTNVEPERELYDSFVSAVLKDKESVEVGLDIWKDWIKKHEKIPTLDQFKTVFEAETGLEPDIEIYDTFVITTTTKIKDVELLLSDTIEELRKFSPITGNTLLGKNRVFLKSKLKQVNTNIELLNDQFSKKTADDADKREIKAQLDKFLELKAELDKMIKSPERERLLNKAISLSSKREKLNKLTEG